MSSVDLSLSHNSHYGHFTLSPSCSLYFSDIVVCVCVCWVAGLQEEVQACKGTRSRLMAGSL